MFRRAIAGKGANIFGDPDARHTFVYVADFALAMVRIAERDDAMGKTWHVPCPPPLTQRAMVDMIFQAIGRAPKLQALPHAIMVMLSWFMPIMRELREMEYQWRMDYDFRHDAYDRAFGPACTPHERGIEETVTWFRARAAH